MNNTLTSELFSIIQTLTKVEIKEFSKTGNAKEPKSFIKLFECYLNLIKNGKEEIFPNDLKAIFKGDFIESNKYLRDALFKFLVSKQEERNQSELIVELENKAKLCQQLSEKKLFSIALKYLKEIIKELIKLKSFHPDAEEIIVAFRVYPLITEIAWQADEVSRNELFKFKELYIEPFYNIAASLQNKQQYWNQNRSNDKQQYIFSQLQDFAFFSMLKTFSANKKYFDNYFDQEVAFNGSFANAIQSLEPFGNQNQKVSEIAKYQLGETVNFYHLISSFFAAAGTINEYEFMKQFSAITQNLWHHVKQNSFPLALAYFINQKIFEAQVIYISKSDYQINPSNLLELNVNQNLEEQLKNMYENIYLFKEEKYNNTAIRLEINNLIWLFISNQHNDFVEAYIKLEKVELEIIGKDLIYLKLMMLISSWHDIRILTSQKQSTIINWFDKTKNVDAYSKKAFKIIKTKIDQKPLTAKLMNELKSLANNKNHFHMVIIMGIDQMKRIP